MEKSRKKLTSAETRIRQSAYRAAHEKLTDEERKSIAAVCVRLRSSVPAGQKGMSADTALEIVSALGMLLVRET